MLTRTYRWALKEVEKGAIGVCVECLIGKQNKPILFKVTEPSSVPYRTSSACAKRATVCQGTTLKRYCMPREHICFSLSKHARIDFILYTCTIVALPPAAPTTTHTQSSGVASP